MPRGLSKHVIVELLLCLSPNICSWSCCYDFHQTYGCGAVVMTFIKEPVLASSLIEFGIIWYKFRISGSCLFYNSDFKLFMKVGHTFSS